MSRSGIFKQKTDKKDEITINLNPSITCLLFSTIGILSFRQLSTSALRLGAEIHSF